MCVSTLHGVHFSAQPMRVHLLAKSLVRVVFVVFLLVSCGLAQSEKKALTIETIFADGGITGRAPENVKWGRGGKSFSFIQRDDSGEHGELWTFDATTGEKRVLLSDAKLAPLSPPLSTFKDDRERERVTRYHQATYLWSPDSSRLLFSPRGQLWLYSVDSG